VWGLAEQTYIKNILHGYYSSSTLI